ncbi:hypothetical protein Pla8534_04740 [Lignipirellula cremea]|uniref:Uncharacterized protein n=1 Tax=Lignipirellula cremea TaxID=2528010 RepID=A0A518DLL6_9BACT|nr:hypothetical protein Pla8534_04740 [Lignipirellula cremea]
MIPVSPPTCSPSCEESRSRYNLFSRKEISPASCFQFEKRLERLLRELGRLILQQTIRRLESPLREQTVASFVWNGEHYRRNRRTANTIDTSFGTIAYERWFFQNRSSRSPGVAPLDVRLGVIAGRMTPALAEVACRLAADLPQPAALHMLQERFTVKLSVDAYRRVIAELATQVLHFWAGVYSSANSTAICNFQPSGRSQQSTPKVVSISPKGFSLREHLRTLPGLMLCTGCRAGCLKEKPVDLRGLGRLTRSRVICVQSLPRSTGPICKDGSKPCRQFEL